MAKPNSNLDGFYQDLADRFGALGRFFGQLSSPKAAQELIDSLTSEDGAAFNRLIDGIEIPMPGKCFWVLELVKKAVANPTNLVQDCYLRDNLTRSESQTYLQILWRHFPGGRGSVAPPIVTQEDGRQLIGPGTFLDELNANGLVLCGPFRQAYDPGITVVFSRSETICKTLTP